MGVSIDAEGAARLVRRHAIDAAGALDRAAFSAALAEARIDLAGTSDSGVIGAAPASNGSIPVSFPVSYSVTMESVLKTAAVTAMRAF